MTKTLNSMDCAQMARNQLISLKANKSWYQLAKDLKVNQGYLYNVAIGLRKPSRRLIAALNIPKPKRRTYDMSYLKLREKAINILRILHPDA